MPRHPPLMAFPVLVLVSPTTGLLRPEHAVNCVSTTPTYPAPTMIGHMSLNSNIATKVFGG